MDLGDCIRFAKENPVTFIGTAEGDQPRVRAFSMWTADMSGFYYHTGTTKEVYRQLQKNPKLELCFCTPPGPGICLRGMVRAGPGVAGGSIESSGVGRREGLSARVRGPPLRGAGRTDPGNFCRKNGKSRGSNK